MTKFEPVDGHVRVINESDIKVGNVFRMVNSDGSSAAFSDAVITKVDEKKIYLSRPMMYSNGRVVTEEFTVDIQRVLDPVLTSLRVVLNYSRKGEVPASFIGS